MPNQSFIEIEEACSVSVRALRMPVALSEIVVAPDGEVESTKGNFVVDSEAFEEIVKRFAEHGTDLPVDYEHQTLGGDYASPDGKAPAAGWIKALTYQPGRGIVAKVEWTEKARAMIQSGEYGYMSPVVLVRKSDRRAIGLHSVALTNKPAIANLERLVAKELGMSTATKEKPKAQANADGADMTPLARIAEAVGLTDIGDDMAAALDAILSKVAAMKPASTPADAVAAKDALAKVAGRVGLAKDATAETIVAKIDELRAGTVNAEQYEALKAKVADLQAKETDRTVNVMLAEAISAGKLNPNDSETLAYWREVCSENPQHFQKLMAKAPKVWPGEGAITPDATGAAAPKGDRVKLIDKYKAEWTANRDQPQLEQTDCWAYVQACLQCDGHASLTASERTALTPKEVK